MTASFLRRATLIGVAAALVAAGSAGAVIGLPSDGTQVNNDPADGIDPHQNAGVSDVVGGSLVAGGPRVPWATFEQKAGGAQRIFVRAFKNGQWVTQGPSLNIDPNVEAEAPSIDFAGAGRTVPWDAWYEPNAALGGEKQIFASRFVAANNMWQPEGQDRGAGVPSLNINTDKEAENPSVAGGAAVAGADPVPWVAWQEQDGNVNGSGNHDQIFVSKGVKQAAPNAPCTGFKPSANASVEHLLLAAGRPRPARQGRRLVADRRPDAEHRPEPQRHRARHRVHRPERHRRLDRLVREGPEHPRPARQRAGLRGQDRRRRERRRRLPLAGRRQRHHRARSTCSTPRASGFGACAASTDAEDACSLNKLAGNDAEDPRVAAGTLTPGSADGPVGRVVGGRRRPPRDLRLAPGRRRPLRAVQRRQPGLAPERRRRHAGHHVLRQHAVRLVDRRAAATDKRGFVGHFDAYGQFVSDTPGGIRLTTRRASRAAPRR